MIVTVASFKGGVGKTTTAFHLAQYFSERGATLLVDGDPNRSATEWARRGEGEAGQPTLAFKVVDERASVMHAKAAQYVVIDTQARPTTEDLKALVEGCDLLILPTTSDLLAAQVMMTTVSMLRSLKSERFRVLLTRVRGAKAGKDARETLIEGGLPVFEASIPNLVVFETAANLGVPVSAVKDANAARAWDAYAAVGREVEAVNMPTDARAGKKP